MAGKIIIPKDKLQSWEGVIPEFRDKVKRWVASLPFDVQVNSAFRSVDDQARLLAEAKSKGEKKKVNKPGRSPHNFGVAVDLTPVPRTDKNIKILADTCKAFGIKREPTEHWHFQDSRFSTSKIDKYLRDKPLWLFANLTEGVVRKLEESGASAVKEVGKLASDKIGRIILVSVAAALMGTLAYILWRRKISTSRYLSSSMTSTALTE